MRHRHAHQHPAHLVVGPEDAHPHLAAQRHRRTGAGSGEVPHRGLRPARPPPAVAARHIQRAARQRDVSACAARPHPDPAAEQRTGAAEHASHRRPAEADAMLMAQHAVRWTGHGVQVARADTGAGHAVARAVARRAAQAGRALPARRRQHERAQQRQVRLKRVPNVRRNTLHDFIAETVPGLESSRARLVSSAVLAVRHPADGPPA